MAPIFAIIRYALLETFFCIPILPKTHKCAVKNTSICKYFCGIQYLDSVLCSYPNINIKVLRRDEMDREMTEK